MPLVSADCLDLAIKNIASFGDTDLFPFPIDNHIFNDRPSDVKSVLLEIDKDFSGAMSSIPILTSKDLCAVGYAGFRQGTQIDPIWNAYLLALVLTIAPELEARRLSPSVVYSYRYKPDAAAGSLFDRGVGWVQFQASARVSSNTYPYALRCDISDFYPRIYHHRLENALSSATTRPEIAKRIMEIVSAIAEGPSYGLPVGGAASRILSEILLNRVDRLLMSEKMSFVRFVDDYVVFAENREAAHSALISITKLLLTNEGLTLQKAKTRLMTAQEFRSTFDFSEAPEAESKQDQESRIFRKLHIYYDPYSTTAAEDYKTLAAELKKFDIVGMLGRELAKSRIDEGLTRRLLAAIRHLDPNVQNDAVRSMLSSLDLLYPLFPAVMQLCRSLLPTLEEAVRELVFEGIRTLITTNSYITQVPANLSFALKVLVFDHSEEAEIIFASTYSKSTSMMIRRDIILMMAYRGSDYWVSNCRLTFATVTAWEKRALLIASYTLGDEGKHWRDSVRKDQNDYDKLAMKWVAESKSSKGVSWRLPI